VQTGLLGCPPYFGGSSRFADGSLWLLAGSGAGSGGRFSAGGVEVLFGDSSVTADSLGPHDFSFLS